MTTAVALPRDATVAVIGSGAMGVGIAQIAAQAGQRYVLVSCGEAHVDALMQQALAPSLRSWAGIAQEPSGGAPSMQMAG